jgi:RNA polymerase sigma-70 factor (ECF subfamily)
MIMYEGDDKLLLKHLEVGDERAVEFIYKRYRKILTVSALILLKDEEIAKDVVQQFYIDFFECKLYLKINTPYNIKAYLVSSIRNRCLNLIRDNSRQRKRMDRMFAELTVYKLNEEVHCENDITSQLHAALFTACIEVPISARTLELRYYRGMSRQEIARTLGVSVNTVKNNLIRGLRILRKYIVNSDRLD